MEVWKRNLTQGLNTYNKCLLRTSSRRQLLTLRQTFYIYVFQRLFFVSLVIKYYFQTILRYLRIKAVAFIFFLIKTKILKKMTGFSTFVKKSKWRKPEAHSISAGADRFDQNKQLFSSSVAGHNVFLGRVLHAHSTRGCFSWLEAARSRP